jgi:hypothetical protein
MCLILCIPIFANAQTLGESTKKTQQAVTNFTKSIMPPTVTKQDNGNLGKYTEVIDTCRNNSGNRMIVELCDKLEKSFDERMKQFYIDNNSTIQQILSLPSSGFVK